MVWTWSLADLPVGTQVKHAKFTKIKRVISTLLELQQVCIIRLKSLNRSLQQTISPKASELVLTSNKWTEEVEGATGPSSFYLPLLRASSGSAHKRRVDRGGGTDTKRRHLGTGLACTTAKEKGPPHSQSRITHWILDHFPNFFNIFRNVTRVGMAEGPRIF